MSRGRSRPRKRKSYEPQRGNLQWEDGPCLESASRSPELDFSIFKASSCKINSKTQDLSFRLAHVSQWPEVVASGSTVPVATAGSPSTVNGTLVPQQNKRNHAHRGARTHDHKVKSLALYQLS
uniref:Uncharacterized protein n=1 Tax=Populus alba TaxID=43335 RepID=A0A4U5P473_POPAL|nr:hypothetical protein D5086_0000226200 [Populus alba]